MNMYCPKCGNPTNIAGMCSDWGCGRIEITSPSTPIDQLEEKFITITELLEKRVKEVEDYATKPVTLSLRNIEVRLKNIEGFLNL